MTSSLISCFLLIAVVVNYGSYCHSQRPQCQLTNDHIRRFGLYLSSSNRTHPSIVKPLDVGTILPKISRRGGDTDHPCVISDYSSNDAKLNERVICPWEWHINFNKFRIPQSLVEASCKCDKIKEIIRGASNEPMIRLLECEPVYYSVRVFMFDENCNEYKETVEELPLACVAINDRRNQMIRGDYGGEHFISGIL